MSYYVYAKNKEHDKDHLKVEEFFSFLRIIFGFGYCVTTWSQLECQLWGEEEKKLENNFFPNLILMRLLIRDEIGQWDKKSFSQDVKLNFFVQFQICISKSFGRKNWKSFLEIEDQKHLFEKGVEH